MATTPFATFSQAQNFGSGVETLRSFTDPTAQLDLMIAATENIEDRCDRRLAPFTQLTESCRLQAVDQDELGSADMPMDLLAASGYSQALAFQSVNMVRDVFLTQYPPRREDLWEYNIDNILLIRAYGDTQIVPTTSIEGPWDTGHFRFQLGIFAPVGTECVVTYDGGYTVNIPYALQLACIYQAIKMAVIGAEPESRKELSLSELEGEILKLIAPYIR
jgi:hypothetical protein